MANKVYESAYIYLTDKTELYITPLKIKYLRQFMDAFDEIKNASSENETLDVLLECVRISMKQYYPILKTVQDVEDNIDMETLYKILEIAGGIKINDKEKESIPEQAAKDESAATWSNFDLVSLESEAFLLGIWKDYEELETSLSMEELTEILNAKREADYNEKKFLAAMQGVDLDKENGKANDEVDPWEAMKARVFSGGKTIDPNDVVSLQGINAAKAGFGIGNGLSYETWD